MAEHAFGSADGCDWFVSSHQHLGLGHNEGWPIPLWVQVGGAGWHFSIRHQPFAPHWVQRTESLDGWKPQAAEPIEVGEKAGALLRLTHPGATLTTPPFEIDPASLPFVRLEWSVDGLPATAKTYLEWTTTEQPGFDASRRVYFSPPPRNKKTTFTHVSLQGAAGWDGGKVTRLRIGFGNTGEARVAIHSLIVHADTRHPINNAVYLQGCDDYVRWTGDLNFLRENMGRMRTALRYGIEEFGLREHRHAVIPWAGHAGRPGLELKPDGRVRKRPYETLGGNYWDLLPMGGHDPLATLYYHDALRRMAALERAVREHPEWAVPLGADAPDPDDLRELAESVRRFAQDYFWDQDKGRFVSTTDADGQSHDVGFTILNLEMIHYGLASDAQAKRVLQWLSGERTVKGDTSTGDDIYHWRFGPRATTRRNLVWYSGGWNPFMFPWGDQVQDGGAVLGFSYFDLMARLRTRGPDDAWNRLREILRWYREVQAQGGYRAYYAQPGRGRLQGAGTAGGLGLDAEFSESILVPQVMIHGFLGLRPTLEGFALRPALPRDWPELTVTDIRVHGLVFDAGVTRDGAITLTATDGGSGTMRVFPPPGRWRVERFAATSPNGTPASVTTINAQRGIPLDLAPGDVIRMTVEAD